MKVIACNSYEEASQEAAKIFEQQIIEKPDSVLGLATGSTPIGMYDELVRVYEAGNLDFSRVTTVNLDEYYPIAPDHPQSYRRFMNEHLFDRVNIDKSRTFVPDGQAGDPVIEGKTYDIRIERLGGIDLQLLGIGRNGHIGFNEPATEMEAGTHPVDLTESTIEANARFFASADDVPRRAITMGLGNILKAKKIVLIACGKDKHEAVSMLVGTKLTLACPATLLKTHPDFTLICDGLAFNGR